AGPIVATIFVRRNSVTSQKPETGGPSAEGHQPSQQPPPRGAHVTQVARVRPLKNRRYAQRIWCFHQSSSPSRIMTSPSTVTVPLLRRSQIRSQCSAERSRSTVT